MKASTIGEMDQAITKLEHRPVDVVPPHAPALVRDPGIGLLVFFIGTIVFGVLAFNVLHNGPLIQYDQPIATALHNEALNGPWPLLLLMWGFSALGQAGIVAFMLILTVIWIREKRWRYVFMLILGVGGGEALFQLLSNMIHRHRPVFAHPLEVLPGPGFPSGHTTTAILLFGLMVYLLWRRLPSHGARVAAVIIAALVVSLIGFARMFIGDHYLTDIVSGMALGTAWFGLIYTTIEMVSWRRTYGR